MKTAKSNQPTATKAKSSGGKRAAKAGALLAVAGLTALAVAKGLKSRRGRALKKKAQTAIRKTMRKAKSSARAAAKRTATKRPTTRARRTARSR